MTQSIHCRHRVRWAIGLILLIGTIGWSLKVLITDDVWTAIDNDASVQIHRFAKDGLDLRQTAMLSGQTLLEYAFEHRKKIAFKALLDCGFDPDMFLVSRKGRNQTITFRCAGIADSYWLKEVLAHNADPNLWTKTHPRNSATPLRMPFGYSESPRSEENAILLIDAGARLNVLIGTNQNPLSLHAMHNAWGVVLHLLEKGADPHIGPQYNVFFTNLKEPGDYWSEQPEFIAVQKKLEEMNLDVAKATWNGKSWDVPKLRDE